MYSEFLVRKHKLLKVKLFIDELFLSSGQTETKGKINLANVDFKASFYKFKTYGRMEKEQSQFYNVTMPLKIKPS